LFPILNHGRSILNSKIISNKHACRYINTNKPGRQTLQYIWINITVDKIMAKFYQKFIHVNGYKITFDTKILTDLDFRKYNVGLNGSLLET
jgi:hypothetical protein